MFHPTPQTDCPCTASTMFHVGDGMLCLMQKCKSHSHVSTRKYKKRIDPNRHPPTFHLTLPLSPVVKRNSICLHTHHHSSSPPLPHHCLRILLAEPLTPAAQQLPQRARGSAQGPHPSTSHTPTSNNVHNT